MSKPSENGQDPEPRVNHEDWIDHRCDAPKRAKGWAQYPRWIEAMCEDGEITESQRRLLFKIASQTLSWGRSHVKATNAKLAEEVGVGERRVRRLRNDLLRRSLLFRDRREGGVWAYRIGDPDLPDIPVNGS